MNTQLFFTDSDFFFFRTLKIGRDSLQLTRRDSQWVGTKSLEPHQCRWWWELFRRAYQTTNHMQEQTRLILIRERIKLGRYLKDNAANVVIRDCVLRANAEHDDVRQHLKKSGIKLLSSVIKIPFGCFITFEDTAQFNAIFV